MRQVQVGWLAVAVLVGFVAGCGGSTPEPAASNEAPAEATSEVSGEGPPSSEEGPKKEPPAEEASATDGDVLNKVLQLVIEDEELDKVLHLTQPGRFPLKVAGKEIPSSLSLTKGTKPVAVVSEPSDKKEAVLVFTSIEVSARDAVVSYKYDVEGIKGTARLKKGDQGWELTSSRIVER